jgi:hypothetical protein
MAVFNLKGLHVDLEKLMARYLRLQQELSIVYLQQPWQSGRIDRLANELATVERQMAALQASNGQHSNSIGGGLTSAPP